MITLYLIFKLTEFLLRMLLWIFVMIFKMVFLPFTLISWIKNAPERRRKKEIERQMFWDGLVWSSFWW